MSRDTRRGRFMRVYSREIAPGARGFSMIYADAVLIFFDFPPLPPRLFLEANVRKLKVITRETVYVARDTTYQRADCTCTLRGRSSVVLLHAETANDANARIETKATLNITRKTILSAEVFAACRLFRQSQLFFFF